MNRRSIFKLLAGAAAAPSLAESVCLPSFEGRCSGLNAFMSDLAQVATQPLQHGVDYRTLDAGKQYVCFMDLLVVRSESPLEAYEMVKTAITSAGNPVAASEEDLVQVVWVNKIDKTENPFGDVGYFQTYIHQPISTPQP